jgi:hypothetical protein
MIRTIVRTLLISLCFSALGYSQDFSVLWQSHYSYNEIIDVVNADNRIYAAAQNAVFEYDTLDGELRTITTVEGLSGQEITTIYYSEIYQYLLIGYETGLIEVYSETDSSVLTIVDILDKQNITPENKRINHFYENNGFVYISTDYGVSVYDLERLEFGDTYFIGNGGSQIKVEQVSINNNEIFVACQDNNGIKKADLSNPNLIDYQQWSTLIDGNHVTMSTLNNKVYSVRSNRVLYEIDGSNLTAILTLPSLPLDADVANSNLIFTATNAAYVYDENIQLLSSYSPNEDFDTNFSAATQVNDNVYIGTTDFGVLSILLSEVNNYTQTKPNGPSRNGIFRLNATTGNVYTTYGEFTQALNPFPLTSRGMSIYRDEVWENIPFDSLLGARELNEITPNIFNPNQVFVSSYKDGILEFNDFEPTILYNQTNSGLESLILPNNPNFVGIRVSGAEFDSSGLLWSLTSRVDKALKSYNPMTGAWQGYSFSSLIDNALSDEVGFFDMEIDNNGTKWIGSYTNGLIAYNENKSNPIKNLSTEEQNLPALGRVQSLALDDRNQLWVGTTLGLRVLFNTSGFFEAANPTLSQIIILEDGIPKELLEDQSITDIKVDGSNNKWVGTADSGVFYFSPDGQTTIYHFTVDNSPLPSNTVNDISIDSDNGIVYIATIKGLLAFNSGGSKPEETLDNAYVYPNPVRPEYDVLGYSDLNDINKGIKISGLTESVNIKITDIEGNLVAEAQSNVNLRSSSANYNFAIDGGTAVWNGKNLGNSVVRSGVYLILISDLDSFETKVLKVLIVR